MSVALSQQQTIVSAGMTTEDERTLELTAATVWVVCWLAALNLVRVKRKRLAGGE